MTDFNFFGPFNFNDFDVNGIFKNNAPNKYNVKDAKGKLFTIPNINQPGIYIWGNLFDIDSKKKLLHPTDCTINNFKYNPKKHQFVPYYVGISIKNMFKERLLKHRDVRQGNAVGYIRFSFDYWKEFFKDADFHRDSSFLIDIVRKNKNSIIYHNDQKVLRLIYPDMEITSIPSRKYKGEQKYDHPITAQIIDGVLLPDTLSEVVVAKKNFWFCFTPFSKAQYSNKDLKSLETFVFYCLKGKTTSRKDNCPLANRLINIIDNTNNSRIFKKIKFTDNTELIFPLNEFWGY
jgi:hypothetical protein